MTTSPSAGKRVLVVGFGYLGSRLTRSLHQQGCQVWATTRTPDKLPSIRQAGGQGVLLDLITGQGMEHLPRVDAVVYCAAPPRGEAATRRRLHGPGLRRLLDHLTASPPERFVLISSTGVYGPQEEGWITEQTPPAPATEAGAVLLEAERMAQQALGQERLVVLRLAGLYGPGRVPYLRQLRAGEPLAVPQQGFLNLIHVEDAAEAARLALGQPQVPPLVLVSDGHPVRRTDYYAQVASLIGAPPPRFVAPLPESPKAQRATGSKRISNRLLLRALAFRLRFPSYRQGLAHALAPAREGGG